MKVSGVGSYSNTDGTVVIYDEDGVMHELKVPYCIIGDELEQDNNGDWHVIPNEVSDKRTLKTIQADKLYYAIRDFINYEDYLFIVNRYETTCYDRFVKNPFFLSEDTKDDNGDKNDPIISFRVIDKNVCIDTFEKRKFEIRAAAKYVLNQNEVMGNTWMYYSDFEKRVNALITGDGHPLIASKDILPYMIYFNKDFHVDKHNGKLRVSLFYTHSYEKTIGNMVHRLINERTPFPLWDPEYDKDLIDEQKSAVLNSIVQNGKISVITGGPGTGKTTILRNIVINMQRLYPETQMVMLSTTGKAAKVMQKTFGDLDVYVSTVHKFLGYGHTRSYTENERIRKVGFIVIDEASMLNLQIFASLIEIVDFSKCKIILVGDIDQLPCIGAGNILSDVIDLGAYTSYLTVNHRSCAGIIGNAAKIREGIPFLKEDETFEIKDVPSCVSSYLACYADKFDNNDRILMSPYKKSGLPGSTSEMNALVHGNLFSNRTNSFCKGDRVIIINTNYDSVNKDKRNSYFNGEPGEIVRIQSDNSYVVNLYDRQVTVKNKSDMALGYAITIHKSQGSEYEVCDICIPEYSDFITRRMLYTAVTRAKQKVRLWANKEVIRKIILNNPDEERRTFLNEI